MFLDVLQVIVAIQQAFLSLWWLWLFMVLVSLSYSLWMTYIQEHFRRSIPWTMFEMKVPMEVRKSPRAMEQVFMSVHGIRNSPSNLKEWYWEGEVVMWFSFEIVSHGGETHFYVRVPSKHGEIIRSAFYAHYSDVDLEEVKEDYIYRFPRTMKKVKELGYRIFGNKLVLEKPDAYPIRTYVDFEDNEEERQLDPIATILEFLNKLKPEESIWVQMIFRPADDSWRKKSELLVKKIRDETGRTQVETKTGNLVWVERTPGQLDTMKAIERCIAKPGFDTVIRYIYIAKKEVYDEGFGRRGILQSFNQYASESLNKFAHNVFVWTRISPWRYPFIFAKKRRNSREDRIWENYRRRHMHDERFMGRLLELKFFHWGLTPARDRVVLNVEEAGTIFHPPTNVVLTGPLIKRVEAKKTGPPAGLPIYGEKGESENLPGMK
jgi:hypothetical protein